MSEEYCKACNKLSTPWYYIHGHICDGCYYNLMENKWIPLSKYNPPFDMPVLAVIVHPESIGSPEIQVCILSSGSGEWFTDSTLEDKREPLNIGYDLKAYISHWKVLPDFPKGEENE